MSVRAELPVARPLERHAGDEPVVHVVELEADLAERGDLLERRAAGREQERREQDRREAGGDGSWAVSGER